MGLETTVHLSRGRKDHRTVAPSPARDKETDEGRLRRGEATRSRWPDVFMAERGDEIASASKSTPWNGDGVEAALHEAGLSLEET